MTRAKRRSVAQKIGRQGELMFEAWATEGHFSASKLQDDFGVDYVCQQMLPAGKATEEMTGLSVFVQVRATSTGKRPRIGLGREDVETALRHTEVFCLVGVHMPTREVFFRWLDISLLEEWAVFLKSDRKTITLLLDSMSQDVERFSRELVQASRPAQRAKFVQARVRMRLEAAMPGSRLRMNTGAMGEWAAVVVPHILSIVNAGTDEHEALAMAMFRPTPFKVALREILARHAPHKALSTVGDLVDGPVWVAGGAETEVTLEIEHDSQRVLCPFTLRRVRDERAYIGSSGLVLRITDTRQMASGEHVHRLSCSVEEDGSADLPTSGQLDFLRMLVPGARLNEAGRPLIPVDHFGVPGIGRSIAAIELTFSRLGLPLTGVRLSDLSDEIFAFNLGVLEALVTEGPPVLPGFVMELDKNEISEACWEPLRYRVPITLRMKEHKILAWVEGDGDGYVHDGAVQGLRFRTRDATNIEVTNFPLAGSDRAMAHFVPGWRPLILAQEKPEFVEPIEGFPFHAQFSAMHAGDSPEKEDQP